MRVRSGASVSGTLDKEPEQAHKAIFAEKQEVLRPKHRAVYQSYAELHMPGIDRAHFVIFFVPAYDIARDPRTLEDPELLRSVFQGLLKHWKGGTSAMSSTETMKQHPAYTAIISWGERAIPLLLSEMENNATRLMPALRQLTGENPIPPEDRGNVAQMREHWLRWGREHGYI